MNKNPLKSGIKSTVRVIWKTLFKPLVKSLPDGHRKEHLLRFGGKIERREWWPKPPKNIIKQNMTPETHHAENHTLDDFLLQELKDLGGIEPSLQPSRDFIGQLVQNRYHLWPNLEHNSYGEAYGLLARHLGGFDFDTVFLAPWLKRGGADLGLLHHIHAQNEKGMRILLITTEKAKSSWLDRLPPKVVHLDFAAYAHKLNNDKASELLARVLLQTTAQTIHNINSALGWQVYKRFGLQLNSMHKKLFASVFCEDEYEPDIYFGYAHHLPETFRFMQGVFCDTRWYPEEQDRLTGLGGLFTTVYFPFLGSLKPYAASGSPQAPVLWASRIAKQKRPELLYQIAKAMPEQEFHVYGEADSVCGTELAMLKALPNIKYFGKYDSFANIAAQTSYAAFLYTSGYDGLPNVLIEAIANGLPVISYQVGGIAELVHADALLCDDADFADNLAKIKTILADKARLQQTWQHSHDLLASRHSWNSFIHVLESIDNYFPSADRSAHQAQNSHIRVLTQAQPPLHSPQADTIT